jgi:rhodanese-related sulfurtransferase
VIGSPAAAPAAVTPAARAATSPAVTPLPALVTPSQAAALFRQGAFFLDVREPSEWLEGHVPGATLIPLEQLPGRVGEVPADRPVVVICRTGNRSAAARDFLRNAGFKAVSSVQGGIVAWQAAGLPVRTGP